MQPMTDINQIKARLKMAREFANLSPRELADLTNCERQSVQKWENPSNTTLPSMSRLALIIEATKASSQWLLTGEGSNVTYVNGGGRMCPVISWSCLQHREPPRSAFDINTQIERYSCPSPCGPETYILRVTTNGMVSNSPKEKSYPIGSIIYCDPDPDKIENVASGTPVVVWLTESKTPGFLIYHEDSGKRWLQSLADQPGVISEPFEIRAIVLGVFI